MPDLDFVTVVGRFGITAADTADLDDDPNIIWCDAGDITLEPLIAEAKVVGGSPVPWTGGQASYVPTIDAAGFLTWRGQHLIKVIDLTSTTVNPRIIAGKATHKVTFRNVKSGNLAVTFTTRDVRLAADTVEALSPAAAAAYDLPEGTLVCDLTKLLPVPVANSVPIVVGQTGTGFTGGIIQESPTTVAFELTNGGVTEEVELPVGPGGSDVGVAGYLDDEDSDTRAVLDPLVTAKIQAPGFLASGSKGVVWDVLVGASAAVGDGVADDTAALQGRINAAAAFGATALLAEHKTSAHLSVPDNGRVAGRNRNSRIILPAAATFAAFDVDGSSNVQISGLRVTRGTATASGAAAVSVRGNASHVQITDVIAESLYEGFRIEGGAGSVAGICKNVTLTGCVSLSADQYGYRIDETDGVELAHCRSTVSGLDGVKLRRKTKNVVLTGGYYTGATGGDGLDAYAGGDTFTIQGTVFSGNALNGVVIKNDDLNLSDPAVYGWVRNAALVGIHACDNGGSGVTIHRNGSTDDPLEPLVQRISVHGGIFNGNGNYGVFVNARQVSVLGVMAARNGLEGIRVEENARDVDVVACHVAGNSRGNGGTAAGLRAGIYIAGKRVKVWGGSSIGSDPDGAPDDAAVTAGTKTQKYGVQIASTASGCTVAALTLRDNVAAPYLDSALDTMLMNNPSDAATAPVLTMPNNQRIFGHKADGTLITCMYVTTGGGLNIGDAAAGLSVLGTSVTFFPKVTTTAPTATEAKFRLTPGVAPTTPVDGDMWATTAGLFIRIGGVTKTVTLT